MGMVRGPRSTSGGIRARGGARAVRFIQRHVLVPKGAGALRPLRPRPWQREIIHGVLDEPRPRQALVSIRPGMARAPSPRPSGCMGLMADGLEVLDSDGIPVSQFFQNAAPMGPATARAYQLIVDAVLADPTPAIYA